MTLHKLTAGDGYTYLTRQVAAHDATELGRGGLGAYYSERGESPGTWWGQGLVGVDLDQGSLVSEAQMKSLFGRGEHPDAAQLLEAWSAQGVTAGGPPPRTRLGLPFKVFEGGATPFQRELARRFGEFNAAHGRGWGEAVPAEERARIRSAVAEERFTAQHGRGALDARELAGFVAAESRQQTKAVAGYDLTFTPVKSVSVLWALSSPKVAALVQQAHDAAVSRTLNYLEREVLFTRRGRDGVRQVRTRGLLTTRFIHRDSRAGDPNLHTHVAVSNKVQDETGRWLAVDGRVLHKAAVVLSEMYNSTLEAELTARLPVTFAPRPEAVTSAVVSEKRLVRELAGVDPNLLKAWSTRSAAIEGRRRTLAAQFQATHGRPPTATESIALAQQANLETRPEKHVPRSEAEQRAVWQSEAVAVLGSRDAVGAMVSDTLRGVATGVDATSAWIDQTAREVVSRVEADRAHWQVWHLRAEAWRRARGSAVTHRDSASLKAGLHGGLEAVVDRVVSRAVEAYSVALPTEYQHTTGTPAALTREDGAPVYRVHGSQQFTSTAVLNAERRLLAAARLTDGRVTRADSLDAALSQTSPARGRPAHRLSTTQTSFVRELATSGRRVQVALAPAGSGKTTTLSVLSDAWRRDGGTVIGLAPSAVAAAQLRSALNISPEVEAGPTSQERATGSIRPIPRSCRHGEDPGDSKHRIGDLDGDGEGDGVVCETLAKYVHTLAQPNQQPPWLEDVTDTSLVIIDEAGMASTADLDEVVTHVLSRGGSVRLVGDDRQLAAIAAGGVLRDLTTEHGAVTLTEIHRFADAAEAAATLAVRDGDPAALGFYADRSRIHVGDTGTVIEDAFNAWVRDLDHGHSSVLLAPTREQVRALNDRAQTHRLQLDDQANAIPSTPSLALREGQRAHTGDRVITRRNNRRLSFGRGDWVKNGDRWTVTRVHPDGALTARHDTHGLTVRLPPDYVADHVDLGYATTIHAAQGITVDSSHTILTGGEDRTLLYVALSRGRRRNDLYLATPSDGDPHSAIHPDTLLPPTPTDVLERILARDQSAVSATTSMRDLADPFVQLHQSTLRYHDAVTFAAEQHLGPNLLRRLDTLAEAVATGLTDQPAWPTLRSHLALLAADGHNPFALLTTTVTDAPLTDTRDAAAVIDARIDELIFEAREETHRTDLDPGRTPPAFTSPPPVTTPSSPQSPSLSRAPSSVSRPAPLPWLPGVPAALTTDPTWGPYLQSRHDQVTSMAAQISTAVARWTPRTAPAWARPLVPTPGTDEASHHLVARLAVWRAAHDVADNDQRPTGPHRFGAPSRHQADLRRGAEQVNPAYQHHRRHWHQHLPESVRDDPWNAVLARRLGALERAGLDVHERVSAALSADLPPLPDAHPAAALWWRLVLHLGQAVLEQATSDPTPVAPDWIADLCDVIGLDCLDVAQTSPGWPALVAAVDDARARHHWQPSALLAATGPKTPPIAPMTAARGAELVESIVLRIATMTDPPSRLAHALEAGGRAGRPDTPPLAPPRVAPGAAPGRLDHLRDELQHDHAAAARIHHLNKLAFDFYLDCYSRSWGPAYVQHRLGRLAPPTETFGYAPAGPRALIRHMASLGVTTDELVEAGLARPRQRRDHDEFVDVFRDRLVLAIRTPADIRPPVPHQGLAPIAGFLGRRNPHREDDQYAGPKYLNSRATAAFQKSHILYGLAEALPAIRAGATPVVVEGPFDALAITLALPTTAIGVAPMGTALTTHQIHLLRRELIGRHSDLAIATDGDSAGYRAAEAAYWLTTAHDLDPAYVHLTAGQDPSSLLEQGNAADLANLFAARQPLGDSLILSAMRSHHDWTDPSTRAALTSRIAHLLAARPIDTWRDVDHLASSRLHLPPGELLEQTLTTSMERDRNPARWTQRRLTDECGPHEETPDLSPFSAKNKREGGVREAPWAQDAQVVPTTQRPVVHR